MFTVILVLVGLHLSVFGRAQSRNFLSGQLCSLRCHPCKSAQWVERDQENELSIARLSTAVWDISVQPVGEGCPLVPRLDEGKGHFSYQL